MGPFPVGPASAVSPFPVGPASAVGPFPVGPASPPAAQHFAAPAPPVAQLAWRGPGPLAPAWSPQPTNRALLYAVGGAPHWQPLKPF